jgi:8-oxo-dGTP diphosphatase
MQVYFYDYDSMEANAAGIQYAVVVARYKRQYLFVKHRERATWEIPGGHREEGEAVQDAAARELTEETGAKVFQLMPLCIYNVERDGVNSYGGLFLADVQSLNETLEYEISTVQCFDGLPEALTYPEIQPFLFYEAQERLKEWLRTNSNLPGPRANLTLLDTFINQATGLECKMCLTDALTAEDANSQETFLLTCGVAASIAHDLSSQTKMAMQYAAHPSWRVREGVCIGFQKAAKEMTPEALLNAVAPLKEGNPFHMRAYVATLCEPALLRAYIAPVKVLDDLLDITLALFEETRKLTEGETALRKALGYGWSVAMAEAPVEGKQRFEILMTAAGGKHIRWIINSNLKKNRLIKMDSSWVAAMQAKINEGVSK